MTRTEPGRASTSPRRHRTEYDAICEELERLRDRVAHVKRDAHDEIAGLTRCISELETENNHLRAHSRRSEAESRARHQTASAEHSTAALRAELKRVEGERDRARKELKNARREMRDLLNGRESLASSTPRSRYTTASSMASPRGFASTPGTTRPAHDLPRSPLSMPQAPPRSRSRAARVSTVHSDEDDQAAAKDSDDNGSEHTVEQPTNMYDNYSYADGSDRHSDDLVYEWSLYTLPAIHRDEYTFGPMTKTEMINKLQANHETSAHIDRMASLKDHRELRFLKRNDTIFVFSPIVLESLSPKRSYIVTWMTTKSIGEVQQIIWGTSEPQAQIDLHTFIDCPSEDETDAWYYVGKLRWTASQLPPQWPKSIKQIKKTLAEAIVQRWQSSQLKATDVGAMIEHRGFEQFEVELGFNNALEAASEKMRRTLEER